jgi:hypothetical protein
MAEWKIRRRHGECTRCQAAFEEAGRHASVLLIDEEQNLLREDLCDACWRAMEPGGLLFWWFTRFYASRKKTLQLDLGSLERLFMELEGREEEKLRELRYLLCLLLMRKRRLKLQKVKRGKQGEELVLRRPRRTEELSVWVYDFTPDRMEELRSRLQEVLDGAGPLEEGDSAQVCEEEEGPGAAGRTDGEQAPPAPRDEVSEVSA